eukprot:2554223-Pleurochrysis_carterae.AAC.12
MMYTASTDALRKRFVSMRNETLLLLGKIACAHGPQIACTSKSTAVEGMQQRRCATIRDKQVGLNRRQRPNDTRRNG